MVTIVKQVKLQFKGRSWVVPAGFLSEEDEEQFVRLRVSCYGLCILLGCCKKIRNPSLKACMALKQLVDARNRKLGLVEEEDKKPKLFGDDERPSPKRKRKAQALESPKLDLDLPDGSGIVTVKAVKWTREDLSVGGRAAGEALQVPRGGGVLLRGRKPWLSEDWESCEEAQDARSRRAQ